MFCPECRQVLKVVEEKAFSALLCGSCGGVFYPKGEFYKHLQLVKTRPMKELAAGDAGERSRAPVQAEELSAACPGCGAPMRRQTYGFELNVMLECARCGGIWARPGQIERVALYLRRPKSFGELPDEVLDRYAKGLLDEEEQKQAFEEAKKIGTSEPSFLACFFQLVPVSDADDLGRWPLATYGLVALNVLLFIFARSLFDEMAMVPAQIRRGFRLYTLITHQFAHAGVMHLLPNMLFLCAFGDRVEDRFGPWRLLGLYLILGVVAGLAHVFMDSSSLVRCVGASGAISGIMGLYLVLFPAGMLRVTLFARAVRVPAIFYLLLWFGMQVLLPGGGRVAVAAHLGGFLAGAWAGGAIRILRKAARAQDAKGAVR